MGFWECCAPRSPQGSVRGGDCGMGTTTRSANAPLARGIVAERPQHAPAESGFLRKWLGRWFSAGPQPTASAPPAILAVTHWKAGSQWLHKILHASDPARVVAPKFPFG